MSIATLERTPISYILRNRVTTTNNRLHLGNFQSINSSSQHRWSYFFVGTLWIKKLKETVIVHSEHIFMIIVSILRAHNCFEREEERKKSVNKRDDGQFFSCKARSWWTENIMAKMIEWSIFTHIHVSGSRRTWEHPGEWIDWLVLQNSCSFQLFGFRKVTADDAISESSTPQTHRE